MFRHWGETARGLAVTLGVAASLAVFSGSASAQNTGSGAGSCPDVSGLYEQNVIVTAHEDGLHVRNILMAELVYEPVGANHYQALKHSGGATIWLPDDFKSVVEIAGPGRLVFTNSPGTPQETTFSINRVSASPADLSCGKATTGPILGPRAPTPAAPAGDYGDGGYGPRAKAALDAVLAPNAPKAKQLAPALDYGAVKDGGPMTEQSRKDHAAAQQEYEKAKKRRMHNSLNDATSCIRVLPTGVRYEWGIEGRFRLLNTCGYPVSVSWCANKDECENNRGGLWNIYPGRSWPIYGGDATNPYIQLGACKEGDAKQPLPPDADISKAGGISEARQLPVPSPGVGLLPSHRCD